MTSLTDDEQHLDDVEQDLLTVLHLDYGYDYSKASAGWLRHKLHTRVVAEQLQTLKGLREKALHDQGCRERLLRSLTLDVNTMFHEPGFFRAFRAKVVPLLRTYPFIRLWHVGCSTGEEVYSMAILLEEEGLYGRCRLYATDADETALAAARDGIFPLVSMREYTANYLQAGGSGVFSEYYTASYGNAIFRPSLKRNIVFAQHSLSTDGAFNEFQAIVCRGMLPSVSAFERERTWLLFGSSLVRLGFLCVGTADATARVGSGMEYSVFDPTHGILRRQR